MAKLTKKEVEYQDYPADNGDHCSVCMMFVSGKPALCTAVKGIVGKNAWCNIFKKSKKIKT